MVKLPVPPKKNYIFRRKRKHLQVERNLKDQNKARKSAKIKINLKGTGKSYTNRKVCVYLYLQVDLGTW